MPTQPAPDLTFAVLSPQLSRIGAALLTI